MSSLKYYSNDVEDKINKLNLKTLNNTAWAMNFSFDFVRTALLPPPRLKPSSKAELNMSLVLYHQSYPSSVVSVSIKL